MKRSNNIRRIALYGFLLVLVLASCISSVLSKYTSDVVSDKSTIYVTAGSIDLSASEDVNGLVVIPGKTIELDPAPTVTVKAGSEACFVFLKVTDNINTATTFVNYTVDTVDTVNNTGVWEYLNEYGVYYTMIDTKPTADTVLPVLIDDKISVPYTVTAEQLDTVKAENNTITFTAYAVQKTPHITSAATAWQKVLDSQSAS